MSRKYGTFSFDFLKAVGEATGFFSWPLEGTNAWVSEQYKRKSKKDIYNSARNLKKQGWLKVVEKNGKRFLKLTRQGELELLLREAVLSHPRKWDGNWRIVMFDIPESSKEKRNSFRRLLKKIGFKSLQASVFVSPFSLNREAVSFLKQSGLIRYIRMIKAMEIDDDTDLRKKFNLNKRQ